MGPRFAASGGIPTAPPPLKPLVLPRRDPFAADVVRVPTTLLGSRTAGGIAAVQVPDPAAFRRGGAEGLGVIGVIVSDRDAYALVEAGSQIQVVHVHDAFAGSVVSAITAQGVTLANGVTLDIDARPSPAPTGVSATGLGSGPPGTLGGAAGRLGTTVPRVQPTVVFPAGVGATDSNRKPRRAVATPAAFTPGIDVPAPIYSAGGSLFPLLAPARGRRPALIGEAVCARSFLVCVPRSSRLGSRSVRRWRRGPRTS